MKKAVYFLPHLILVSSFILERIIVLVMQLTMEDFHKCSTTNTLYHINLYIFMFVILLKFVIKIINKIKNIELEPSFKWANRIVFILEIIILSPLMLVGVACEDLFL